MSPYPNNPSARKRRPPAAPLVDLLDGGHVRARRWVARRYGFPAAMARTVAEAAGLGGAR